VKHQSIEVCSLSFIFIEAEEKIKDQKLDASASRFLETFKKEMKEGMKNISAKAQNKQGGNVQNTKNAPNSENRSSSSQNSAPQQTQSNTPKTSQYHSENRSSSSQNSAPQQTQSNTPKTSQYQKLKVANNKVDHDVDADTTSIRNMFCFL